VVNRALYWIVNLVIDEFRKVLAIVLVVAVKSKEEAIVKVDNNNL
jgi:hypothetical protein